MNLHFLPFIDIQLLLGQLVLEPCSHFQACGVCMWRIAGGRSFCFWESTSSQCLGLMLVSACIYLWQRVLQSLMLCKVLELPFESTVTCQTTRSTRVL